MIVTLGQQYNVGEKPTVIPYIYINRHAGTPNNYYLILLLTYLIMYYIIFVCKEESERI